MNAFLDEINKMLCKTESTCKIHIKKQGTDEVLCGSDARFIGWGATGSFLHNIIGDYVVSMYGGSYLEKPICVRCQDRLLAGSREAFLVDKLNRFRTEMAETGDMERGVETLREIIEIARPLDAG